MSKKYIILAFVLLSGLGINIICSDSKFYGVPVEESKVEDGEIKEDKLEEDEAEEKEDLESPDGVLERINPENPDEIKNLIIINDDSEYMLNGNLSIVMTFKLVQSLLEGETPILCSTSLFYNIQNIAKLWEDIIYMRSEDFILSYPRLVSYLYRYLPNQNMSNRERVIMLQESITYINTVRAKAMELTRKSGKRLPITNRLIRFSKTEYQKMLQLPIFQKYKSISNQFRFAISNLYTIFALQKIIDLHQYTVLHPSNSYLLFIPKSLEGTPDAHGLFTTIPYFPVDNLSESYLARSIDELSHDFILAIKKIFPERNPHTFWNIIMAGHGSPTNEAAGISTVELKDGRNSIFIQFLQFCNLQIHTKNIYLISCFPGGEKIQQVLKQQSEYSNDIPDLNYTIIFEGSQPTPTVAIVHRALYPPYSREDVSNITNNFNPNIGIVFEDKFAPRFSKMLEHIQARDYDNIVSLSGIETAADLLIKKPHQEWAQPTEFSQDAMKITEVNDLAGYTSKKGIIVPKGTRYLNINTNMILSTVTFTDKAVPNFLPTTHHNYNFLFAHLQLANADQTLSEQEVFEGFYNQAFGNFLSEIDHSAEPMRFYIEKINDFEGYSLLVLISNTNPEFPKNGFIILDHQEQMAYAYPQIKNANPYEEYELAKGIADVTTIKSMNKRKLSITQKEQGDLEDMLLEHVERVKAMELHAKRSDTMKTTPSKARVD